nr:proline-rich protein 36-like [Aegilops tauschii subsp. strangulata]
MPWTSVRLAFDSHAAGSEPGSTCFAARRLRLRHAVTRPRRCLPASPSPAPTSHAAPSLVNACERPRRSFPRCCPHSSRSPHPRLALWPRRRRIQQPPARPSSCPASPFTRQLVQLHGRPRVRSLCLPPPLLVLPAAAATTPRPHVPVEPSRSRPRPLSYLVSSRRLVPSPRHAAAPVPATGDAPTPSSPLPCWPRRAPAPTRPLRPRSGLAVPWLRPVAACAQHSRGWPATAAAPPWVTDHRGPRPGQIGL